MRRLSHTKHQGGGPVYTNGDDNDTSKNVTKASLDGHGRSRIVAFDHTAENERQLSHVNIKDWVHETALSHKHQGLGP